MGRRIVRRGPRRLRRRLLSADTAGAGEARLRGGRGDAAGKKRRTDQRDTNEATDHVEAIEQRLYRRRSAPQNHNLGPAPRRKPNVESASASNGAGEMDSVVAELVAHAIDDDPAPLASIKERQLHGIEPELRERHAE